MKKIQAIAIKGDQKALEIPNRHIFDSSVKGLPKGKYKITIEKYFNKSTPSQFGWLYACVYPHSLIALRDAGYEFITIEEADLFWKMLFANKSVLDRHTGEIVKLPLSKSEFVTIDQAAYCESIRHHCSEYLGYNIPDPDKDYKKKKKQSAEL